MYNLLPLLIILFCLISIVVIIAKKFSILANIDVDSIPSEKEGKFKEKIIGERIKRNFSKWTSRIWSVSNVFFKKFFNFSQDYYNKLKQKKESYSKEIESHENDDDENKIDKMFSEIDGLDYKENFEEIENKLIEIIGVENKNPNAFERLANLYFENKKYKEAKETYDHLLNLYNENDIENITKTYYYIAWIEKEGGNNKEAFSCIKKALSLTPNNPRYLDIMFEISIILRDNDSAKDALDKLREVNPENKKIGEFEEKIKNLEN